MAAKLTTAEWVAKAIDIHGDKYDYSQVNYKNAKTPVVVICRVHGYWNCSPSTHVDKRKSGCPSCGGSKPKTSEDFVGDAVRIHGDLYDYTKVEYVNSHTRVTIVCKTHGPFTQTPTSHLSGAGCRKCSITANFLRVRDESLLSIKKKLFDKNGSAVSIVDESFKNINEEADFVCELHGKFRRLVNSALHKKFSCAQCFYESEKSNILDQDEAEKRIFSMLLDNDFWVESFKYEGKKNTILELNCPKHGKWEANWSSVTRSRANCPKCSYAASIPKRTASINKHNQESRDKRWTSYLTKFMEAHGNLYDYSNAVFVDAKTPIEIVCCVHGSFMQPPDNHTIGGCRLCADDELAGLYKERYFELRPKMAAIPATLYLLKLEFGGSTCFKVGITRTSLERRFGAALGKDVKIEVIAVRNSSLIEVWRDEVRLLSSNHFKKFEIQDKAFARTARISPTELMTNLPENWRQLAEWTSTERYWL